MKEFKEIQIEIEQEIIDNYNHGGLSESGFNSFMEISNKLEKLVDSLETPKHETVEELRVVVEKHGECAKVFLKYGDKLLTSEDINSHNVLVSDMFLSHIRGTVCNLIVDVVKGKSEIKE